MIEMGTVLAVDDTPDSLRMLAEILREERYRVRPADSGTLALAAAKASPPDLILLDIRMPGMNGFEVCRELKENERTRAVPVIFLSASTDSAERVEGLRLGAVDFISKPFQRDELLARVRMHMELGLLRGRLETLVAQRTEQVALSAERLKLATRAANIGVWDWDIVHDELVWDENMYRLYCAPKGEFRLSYESWISRVHPEDAPVADANIQAALRGEREYSAEFRIIWPDKSQHFIESLSLTLRDGNGQPLRMIGTNIEVTERKKAEAELEKHRHHLEELVVERTAELARSEERMRLFFERQLVGMAFTSAEKRWLMVNDKICEMLGYSREELDRLSWTDLVHPEDLHADLAQFERLLVGEIDSFTLETRFARKDGGLVFINLSIGCVRRPDRSVEYVLMLAEDITQRKRAEREAEEALQKEVILRREMHHRVKNNLQVITSLLYLQSIKTSDPNSRALLKESQARVRSIALVHEMLYQREDLTKISFPDYVRQLAVDLFVTYQVSQQTVAIKLGSESVFLPLATAIPCGIIVTELITNALKYAFPEGRKGEIEISLLTVANTKTLALIVRDNGVGLPKNLDVNHTKTMGLSLVHDLTLQLIGTVEFRDVESGHGTEVRIVFPVGAET